MTSRVVEETVTGWTMIVRAQTMFQDVNGQFVSQDAYQEERDSELSGYGNGGYGE